MSVILMGLEILPTQVHVVCTLAWSTKLSARDVRLPSPCI